MKLHWLLLSLCLAVAYSQSSDEYDVEDDSAIEEFDTVIEDLISNLGDDDLTDLELDDFSDFESDESFEEEIQNSKNVSTELFSGANNLEFKDDAALNAFEDVLAGLLSGVLSGRMKTTNTFVLNQAVDKMFANLRSVISKNAFNTISLPDESVKMIKVHGGSLSDFCTLYRNGDVSVTLNTDARKVTLQFPFRFDDLKVHYSFNAKILFIKPSGSLDGSVTSLAFNPVVTYNYNTGTFTLDHFDMKDTGHIRVRVSGHNIIASIVNLILGAVTDITHNSIVHLAENKINSAVQKLLVRLDADIHKKLH